jgi:hypothetical protein
MAHSRRRYAGAVALSGAFAACLATPHPAGTGGGDGGIGPGSGSCTPIDPFMMAPTGVCSTGVVAQNGTLIFSSSGAPLTCQWMLQNGLGSSVFIDLHAMTVIGSSAYLDTLFSLGTPGTPPTLAVSHGGSDPVHYQLLLDGGKAQIQLGSPMWLMFETVDAMTISAKYSFDGMSWSELGRDTFMAGNPTPVELEMQLSGGSGNGSDVFEDFERCQ